MSIDPPWAVLEVMKLLNVDWPSIDEDQLYGVAADLRGFASGLMDSSSDANTALSRVQDVAVAESLGALSEHYAGLHGGPLQQIQGLINAAAVGFDTAAEAVIAIKCTLLAYVAAVSVEIAADTAAAVATGGAAALAEPAILAAARQVVHDLLHQIEKDVVQAALRDVVGCVIDNEIQPLVASVIRQVERVITVDVTTVVDTAMSSNVVNGAW